MEPRKLFEMDESDETLGDVERGRMLAVLLLISELSIDVDLLFAKLIVFRLFRVLLSALLIALPVKPKPGFELNW